MEARWHSGAVAGSFSSIVIGTVTDLVYLHARWSRRIHPVTRRSFFGDLPGWWIAGGWAIDLWLGKQTREHVDLDIATLRKNQRIFWRRLEGWDLHLGTAPDVVEPWPTPGAVPTPLHAVWCRRTPTSPRAFEILLNDSNSTDWLFRRDHSVRLPLAQIGRMTSEGIPYLGPEIVLLYKATQGP